VSGTRVEPVQSTTDTIRLQLILNTLRRDQPANRRTRPTGVQPTEHAGERSDHSAAYHRAPGLGSAEPQTEEQSSGERALAGCEARAAPPTQRTLAEAYYPAVEPKCSAQRNAPRPARGRTRLGSAAAHYLSQWQSHQRDGRFRRDRRSSAIGWIRCRRSGRRPRIPRPSHLLCQSFTALLCQLCGTEG
jgi:hypothetical protein